MTILNSILFILVIILGVIYFYNRKFLIANSKSITINKLCNDIITELPFPIKSFEITKSISKEKVWEAKSDKIHLYEEIKIGHKVVRINSNIPIKSLVAEENTIQEAKQLKEHFVNNVDKKAIEPLENIITLSEELMRVTAHTDVSEIARKIILESNTTINLFENFIVLANLQVNKRPDNNEKIDCIKLLESAKIKFDDKIRTLNKNIELIIDQPYSECTIYPERNKLMLVVDNYLSNAIEYTNEGTIHFGVVETDNNQVLFYVKDTGKGISKKRLAHIFDHDKPMENRSHPGSGLGLNICKQIALNGKGNYGVVSEEGKGSIFWMSLPLKFEYKMTSNYNWTHINNILGQIEP